MNGILPFIASALWVMTGQLVWLNINLYRLVSYHVRDRGRR